MTEHKTYPSKGIEKKGGYPSSSKPNSQLSSLRRHP